MDLTNVLAIARKEIRDSIRNRWFQLDAIAFAVLALSFSYLSLAGSGSFGFAGFGKTAAGLVNLVLLVVPLMAITIGAATIAGDAERGSLAYLLAQPVSRAEVLFGKYLGLAVALSAALALGFGVSGVVLAMNGVSAEVGAYASLVVWALFLALAMLSLGFLVSVFSRKVSVATGAALFLWLALAF
ncbi:MAG TPA: ABC transporter permease subunit, partial [bacterium]|nr:ABC transporter permease subunit [bacterium]